MIECAKKCCELKVSCPISDCRDWVEFEEDFNYRTDIVERSELVFETPILKPNISAFATGKKRNITMSFIFKLCVVLNCSPNDLYDWGLWREKVMKLMDNENRKITNDDIKNLL